MYYHTNQHETEPKSGIGRSRCIAMLIVMSAAWGAIVLALSLSASFPSIPFIPASAIGPTGHVVTHLVLTLLLYALLRKSAGVDWSAMWTAFASSMAAGMLLEFAQSGVAGRSTDPADVAFNAAGGIAAVLCAAIFSRVIERIRTNRVNRGS
jgi:VanZ family protein